MSDLFDRYLQKTATGRTLATIEQVRDLAREQSAIEYRILGSLNDVTDTELQRLMEGAIARAKDEPVNWWDLLRSEQATRLLLWRAVFEIRMVVGVGFAVGFGVFIGYLVWGRSPPSPPPQANLQDNPNAITYPKNDRQIR